MKRLLLTTAAALAASGVAYGAFQVYDSTVSGTSRTNSFDASASHLSKLTISQTGDAQALSPGGTVTIPVAVSNRAQADETTVNLSGTTASTSPDGSCGSHLSVSDPDGTVVGQTVTPGHKIDGTLVVAADGSLPGSCAGGSYVIVFAGTVTP